MELYSVDLPTMYGDHHVTEVRRILLELAGIEAVNASSCFHIVEIKYNPAQITPDTINERLEAAGYLGALTVPQELSKAVQNDDKIREFMRHTAVYEQTLSTVGFAQVVQSSGQALWPCPGIGLLRQTEEGES
jgi:hypothetical protein